MMVRFNIFLLMAVMGSALYLVHVQYESRRLYSELDKLVSQARQLEIESDRLKVALRAQAAAARVESFARDTLKMQAASPPTTHYVADPMPPMPSPAGAGNAMQGVAQ